MTKFEKEKKITIQCDKLMMIRGDELRKVSDNIQKHCTPKQSRSGQKWYLKDAVLIAEVTNPSMFSNYDIKQAVVNIFFAFNLGTITYEEAHQLLF